MAILALVSIFLIILSFGGVINLNTSYPELLNNVLLIVFTIDYFGRLALAKDKRKFFKDNIFDHSGLTSIQYLPAGPPGTVLPDLPPAAPDWIDREAQPPSPHQWPDLHHLHQHLYPGHCCINVLNQ